MSALVITSYLGVPVVSSIPVIEENTAELTINIEGLEFKVTVVKTEVYIADILYIGFNVTCKVDRGYVKLIAPLYPASYYTVQSKALSSPLMTMSAIPSEYKYTWDGIVFVKAPGPSNLWIKYDHPDVYDTYNIGVNEDKSLKGDNKIHIHIAKYHIEDAKAKVDLGSVIASAVQFILALLAYPEVGWVTAAVVAVITAALWLLNRTIQYFLNDVLQDETGAGWMWAWGFGGWLIFQWFWVSFGAWRDIGWFVVLPSFLILGVPGGGGFCRLK
jgi:hypothetical protein